MNRTVNELFVRMENHVKAFNDDADPEIASMVSDLKLFLLMAGDLAIMVEDANGGPTIEVSQEEAERMGLIERTVDSEPVPLTGSMDNTGLYV